MVPSAAPVLAALAGAAFRGGTIIYSADGKPVRADGHRWVGGRSPVTSKETVEALLTAGLSVEWEWHLNVYGTPSSHYPAHQELIGVRVAEVGDFGGQYPGDHAGCCCGWVPIVNGAEL